VPDEFDFNLNIKKIMKGAPRAYNEVVEKKNTLFTDNTPILTKEDEKLNLTLTMRNLKVVGNNEKIE
jgi:hypothetical protein